MTIPSTSIPAPSRDHPARGLGSLALCVLLPSLAVSSANAALPALAQGFGAAFGQVQWVVLAYLLATTALVAVAGRLGDLFGRRRVLLAGIGLFTLASGLCASSPALPWLVAARALQGTGAAAMTALALAFAADVVPKSRLGGAMGLLGTLSAVGTALGPAVGGALTAGFGWPAVFLLNLPLGLAALLLAWHRLPVTPAPRRVAAGLAERLDLPGMALLAFSLAAYAGAMTWGTGRFGGMNGLLLLVAASGAVLFARIESHAPHPLVQLQGLSAFGLASGLAMNLLVSSVVMTTLVVGPFYLSRTLGLAPAGVGLAMCAGPAVTALAGLPAGWLVDRLGAHRMASAGLAGMGLGCLALCLLATNAVGPAVYVACIAFTTAHYALFQAANNTAVMAGADPDRRGAVSGLLAMSRNLGLVSGASALGAVFAAAVPAADAASAGPGAVAVGVRVTFGVAAGLVAVAWVIAMSSPKPPPREPGSEG